MEQYMEQFRQRHKLLSYFLGLGVIIFFNCFGFPIINLNRNDGKKNGKYSPPPLKFIDSWDIVIPWDVEPAGPWFTFSTFDFLCGTIDVRQYIALLEQRDACISDDLKSIS